MYYCYRLWTYRDDGWWWKHEAHQHFAEYKRLFNLRHKLSRGREWVIERIEFSDLAHKDQPRVMIAYTKGASKIMKTTPLPLDPDYYRKQYTGKDW